MIHSFHFCLLLSLLFIKKDSSCYFFFVFFFIFNLTWTNWATGDWNFTDISAPPAPSSLQCFGLMLSHQQVVGQEAKDTEVRRHTKWPACQAWPSRTYKMDTINQTDLIFSSTSLLAPCVSSPVRPVVALSLSNITFLKAFSHIQFSFHPPRNELTSSKVERVMIHFKHVIGNQLTIPMRCTRTLRVFNNDTLYIVFTHNNIPFEILQACGNWPIKKKNLFKQMCLEAVRK